MGMTTLRLCVFATLCASVLAAAQDDTTATHKRSRRSVIKKDLDKCQRLLDELTVHNVNEGVRQWNRLEKLLGKQLNGTLTPEEQASLDRLESFSGKEEQASPDRLAERVEPASCKPCEIANALYGRKCDQHRGGRRLAAKRGSPVLHSLNA